MPTNNPAGDEPALAPMENTTMNQNESTKSFLFRPQRELLCDAMKEVEQFNSKQELIEKLQAELDIFDQKHDCKQISIEKYGHGIDERIGWDTYIVCLPGFGVLGFTNGPVDRLPSEDSEASEEGGPSRSCKVSWKLRRIM
jgi:hypothetical protein